MNRPFIHLSDSQRRALLAVFAHVYQWHLDFGSSPFGKLGVLTLPLQPVARGHRLASLNDKPEDMSLCEALLQAPREFER